MLTKLVIAGYNDTFETKIGEFEVQVNPNQIKWNKGIEYMEDRVLGKERKADQYKAHKQEELSLELVMDDTGVIPSKNGKITDRINQLEKLIYHINADTHEPNYVLISWGKFLFKGRITSLQYDYTLFSSQGLPLRVRISLTAVGFKNNLQEAKSQGLNSPDMSRGITLKSGESLASWCYEIYGDASYCADVAKYNLLDHFRNTSPGTEIAFPPLSNETILN